MPHFRTGIFGHFFRQESAGSVLLMTATILAIILANSPLEHYYNLLIEVPVVVSVGDGAIAKPLLLWVNDGMMAIFFLVVGLELKREFLEGAMSSSKNIVLPAIGAIGGMFVPAAIYLLFNYDNPVAVKGWAIPAATDIAFALGVLLLLGDRVPSGLKIFLVSLAIFDDIGAILIIAAFYTSNISLTALILAGLCVVVLFLLNKFDVTEKSLYIMVGAAMWVALLKSGVHATLTGIIVAMFVPLRSTSQPDNSPLKVLEHDLLSTVHFFILPVFAFCNAGISFAGVGMEQILHSVSLGIGLGLFVGKQVGVFGTCWLALKLGLGQLPQGVSMRTLYGASALCGIGFTMSLFIGSLAFEETGVNQIFDERLGILLGSLVSGIVGYLVLRSSLPKEL